MPTKILFVIIFAAAASVAFLLGLVILPWLKAKKIGQKIREIGPIWHMKKQDTPTMGGIIFIPAVIAAALVGGLIAVWVGVGGYESYKELIPLCVCLGFALVCGAIGFVDDYVKLIKKHNEGLTEPQKFLLQVAAAAAFLYLLTATGTIDLSRFMIPFYGEINLAENLGFWGYILFYAAAEVIIVGFINAVNFTDGLDGLASGVTLVVAAFFGAVALWGGAVHDNLSLLLSSAAVMGGCFGFLFFNFNPAKVFMGDTGSLFLGGVVVGMSFLSGNPIIMIIVGIAYVWELLSVVIQRTVYKLTKKRLPDGTTTGRRVFKMAPFHHHLEKCGLKEKPIFFIFTVITAVFAAVSWFGM